MFRIIVLIIAALIGQLAIAGEVEIKMVNMVASGNTWRASVTLKHADSGWKHFADTWQLVDKDGKVLGIRVLAHPHEHEQPFTRSLSGIEIPEGVSIIYVEARDNVHGWSSDKVQVDLNKESGERFTVRR